MEEKKPGKHTMISWLAMMQQTLDEIEDHIEELPEGTGGWDDEAFHHVAQIGARVDAIAHTTGFLGNGIAHVLANKMRIDASLN